MRLLCLALCLFRLACIWPAQPPPANTISTHRGENKQQLIRGLWTRRCRSDNIIPGDSRRGCGLVSQPDAKAAQPRSHPCQLHVHGGIGGREQRSRADAKTHGEVGSHLGKDSRWYLCRWLEGMGGRGYPPGFRGTMRKVENTPLGVFADMVTKFPSLWTPRSLTWRPTIKLMFFASSSNPSSGGRSYTKGILIPK